MRLEPSRKRCRTRASSRWRGRRTTSIPKSSPAHWWNSSVAEQSRRPMRFIVMHRTDARWEAGAIPSREFIASVGKLIGELADAGVLLGAEGLRASSQGVRLRFSAGRRQVIKGPFIGENELSAGFWIVQVPAIEEALEWASRLAAAIGDVEIDVRPVTEPWDIGMTSAPENLTLRRYMLLRKATAASEAGIRLSPRQRADLGRVLEEMTRTGALLTAADLQPS